MALVRRWRSVVCRLLLCMFITSSILLLLSQQHTDDYHPSRHIRDTSHHLPQASNHSTHASQSHASILKSSRDESMAVDSQQYKQSRVIMELSASHIPQAKPAFFSNSSDMILNIEDSNEPKLRPFFPALTRDEKAILMNLASKISSLCNALDIVCMMYGGSLLGSWRHHDLIPWDDDIDVFISHKHRGLVSRELKMISEEYQLEYAGSRMKFFSVHGRQYSKYPWRWPYIDVSFYKENDTHIWDTAKDMRPYVYPKYVIFPTHKRPLGEIEMDAPRDTYAALKLTYKGRHCQTYFYSHKLEHKVTNTSHAVNCRQLSGFYGFVHREVDSDKKGLRETLVLNDKIMHTKTVDEPKYAVTHPFKLELL